MTDIVMVTTATASQDAAEALAAVVVERRLAACAQVIGPIRSTYRWQGAVEHASEALLVCKTTAAGADDLVAAIESEHPYDVPEITVTPVVGGSRAYLAWVDENVGGTA